MSEYKTSDSKSVGRNKPGIEQRARVAGGVLVYETRELGRELIGFREVSDWDDLADALAVRGHGRGAIYHLPKLDK